MAWEDRAGNGSYYTRSTRRGGRVVREYIGTGRKGALAAAEDRERRASVAALRAAQRSERTKRDADDAEIAALFATVDKVVRSALIGAGYHQHDRGVWRRRRHG